MLKQQVGSKRDKDREVPVGRSLAGDLELLSRPLWAFKWMGGTGRREFCGDTPWYVTAQVAILDVRVLGG